MMEWINPKHKRARTLLRRANALCNDGNEDEALPLYLKAIALNPGSAAAHYNLGMIHKYRNAWPEALECNLQATRLDPADEAACWNLAIAATALKRWDIARDCWQKQGILSDDGQGPIEMDLGSTPVRLNPGGAGEVVWARRLCPVRARIENIPFPESGYAYGDIVLHDGAPVGYRQNGGYDYPVFNVLERFAASQYETFIATVEVVADDDMVQLEALFEASPHELEDWSSNTRVLCSQCSEGLPHQQHDHDLKKTWQAERRLGLAVLAGQDVAPVFAAWQAQCGARLLKLEHGGQGLNVVH